MPVKKLKRGKKVKKPRGVRVASAPTRDVIINITTARPRAKRQIAEKTTPKRNEDLTGRLNELALTQSQFRATETIRQQATQIGLIDKRLSVLVDILDNERNKPLFQAQPADTPTPAEAKAKIEADLERIRQKSDDLLKASNEEQLEKQRKKAMLDEYYGRKPTVAEKKRMDDEEATPSEATPSEATPSEATPSEDTPSKKGRGRPPLSFEEKQKRELQKQQDRMLQTALNKEAKKQQKMEAKRETE
jgi:hypothetical protein